VPARCAAGGPDDDALPSDRIIRVDSDRCSGFVQVRSCFADMVEALENARDFIYITGWSMHPETRLTRRGGTEGVKIGELLKRKAEEKVSVCLLVRAFSRNNTFNKHATISLRASLLPITTSYMGEAMTVFTSAGDCPAAGRST
jgi:phosphatidylserine/phosphatidylglycerophosphate/cardiolipin synthase-like enzyme